MQKEKRDILNKVVVVAGDVTEKDLGLNEKDLARVKNEVTVVFHSAATVRFNERLQDAVRLNTEATQNVIQFCLTIKKLQVCYTISFTFYQVTNNTLIYKVVSYQLNSLINYLWRHGQLVSTNLN